MTARLARPSPDPGGAAAPTSQTCPSLARLLTKVLRGERPQVLDLGPFCPTTAIFLADRGARVKVAEFDPPPPPPKAAPGEAPVDPEPLHIEEPDGVYDLVLGWEILDFLPRSRLAEFGRELGRVMTGGGWALLFALADASRVARAARRPPRYRVLGEDRVAAEPVEGPSLERHVHPTREIERALAPLSIQGIHLQRNQVRELSVYKPMR